MSEYSSGSRPPVPSWGQIPLGTPSSPPELPVVASPHGRLAARRVDAGLVLRQATSEEFLPSVRPWVRLAGLVLLGSVVSGVGLLAVWPYRVVVRGAGLVRPSGEMRLINAPFAARVRQVLVQPDQRVQSGQVLALLDPADLEGRRVQLRQDAMALARQEQALINQASAALQAAELEVEKARAGLRFAEAEYRRFQQLAGTGSITAIQLEEKQENYNVARANLAKSSQAVAEQRSRSLSEQAQLEKERASNRADAGQIARDLFKTAITAPVAGVLYSLSLRNPGQMVAAGQELARVAPSQVGLLVKVQVPSQDIDRVEPGQRADLRISGCPYPDYGTLKASVVSISPDALSSGGGGYDVTLRPDQASLASASRRCDLRLGMDLTAEITTREDKVLSFLLRKVRILSGF